jgi:hypothetical protein
MKILRAQDKTKRVQLERDDSAYAYAYASMLMRHSGKLFGTKGRHKVWVFMATIRLVLETAMSLAQKASEQQCRSQAIMPRLSG